MNMLFQTKRTFLLSLFLGLVALMSCSDDSENKNHGEGNTTDVAVTGAVVQKTATTAEITGYLNLNLLPASHSAKEYGVEFVAEDDGKEHLSGFVDHGAKEADEIVGRQITVELNHLSPNTTYKFRTYLELTGGVSYYGEYRTFKTEDLANLLSNPKVELSYNTATVSATLDYRQYESMDDEGNIDIGFLIAEDKADLDNPFDEESEENFYNFDFHIDYDGEEFGEEGEKFPATVTVRRLVKGLDSSKSYFYRTYTIVNGVERLSNTASFKTMDIADAVKEIMKRTKFITVTGGTFTMGATSEQGSDYYSDERPTHSVTLSTFQIGETEVTQELWEAVMGDNPSYFKGVNLPVENVSWNDCQEFISELNKLTGKSYRLPTEAEWEYAARGGNKSKGYKYSGGNDIGAVAWYDGNASSTHDVATKSPNELGIYDMSGNVWEWCSDWYGSYLSGSQTNPQGPSSGSIRVVRGGSWDFIARLCRVSFRNFSAPGDRSFNLGFRLGL